MKWELPPRIKIYEALGCIADKRVEVNDKEARVYSSRGDKYYNVEYDGKNAIMSNDNGSYWKGYLGYPSIAFLMIHNMIKFNQKIALSLKDIKWKDVNTKFKNDFEKTENYVLDIVKQRGFDIDELKSEVNNILKQIKELDLDLYGKKTKPP